MWWLHVASSVIIIVASGVVTIVAFGHCGGFRSRVGVLAFGEDNRLAA